MGGRKAADRSADDAAQTGVKGAPHTVKNIGDKLAQVNLHKSTCASYFPVCGEKRVHVV